MLAHEIVVIRLLTPSGRNLGTPSLSPHCWKSYDSPTARKSSCSQLHMDQAPSEEGGEREEGRGGRRREGGGEGMCLV